MSQYQLGITVPVVAHSQVEEPTLRVIIEFNEVACREHQENHAHVLEMLDEIEAGLRAGREISSGDD